MAAPRAQGNTASPSIVVRLTALGYGDTSSDVLAGANVVALESKASYLDVPSESACRAAKLIARAPLAALNRG